MPDFIVRFFIRFSLSDLFICTIFLFRFSVGFICLIFSPISCSIFLSDLFVSIYMSDFLSDFMSDFLPDIFVRHVLVRFFSDFLIPFHVRFLPDFCPIFYVRFPLSDFFVRNFCPTCSCPIFFDRFFYPIFVRFILSDVFMTGFLSDFLSDFLADLLSHFLCDFSSKKMEHVSSCNATFVMYYQCVSVFIIMTVSYTRMGVI